MAITNKRRAFIDEYLKDCNATQAAIRAGYAVKTAYSQGNRLLKIVEVAEEIKRRLDEKSMKADEVIQRLTDMARSDMGDFMTIDGLASYMDLDKAKRLGLTHLIKKVKDRVVMTRTEDEETETHYMEIELYDAQAALVQLGRYHKLFTDNMDITSGGKEFILKVVYDKSGAGNTPATTAPETASIHQ
jgi:phage terminase small subunit